MDSRRCYRPALGQSRGGAAPTEPARRARYAHPMDDPFGRRLVGMQATLFVAVAAGPWVPWAPAPGVPPAAAFVGWGLMALGLALALVAGLRLGGNLTPFPRPRPGGSLVTSGVYRLARHPIYGGALLLAVGWAVARSSLVAGLAAALLWALLEAKSRYEERALAYAYPGYPDYAAGTRRFVPFVY